MSWRLCVGWLALTMLVGCGTKLPPEPPGVGDLAPPEIEIGPVGAESDAAAEAGAADQHPAGADGGLELAPPAQSSATDSPPEAAASAPAAPGAAAPATDAPDAEPAEGMERVKAERGVGAKGRSLDEHEGLLVTPAKAYFSVRERAVFDIQIPEALKLYKATNGNGPRSHAEFMGQIIEANQIQLPELPAGQRYVYDSETEQLMVERPAR